MKSNNTGRACALFSIALAAAWALPYEVDAAAAPTGKAAANHVTLGNPGSMPFRAPETIIWDERADVYLVSNMNGRLTVYDDNGFISRVSPDGKVLEARWIDGADRAVTLHAPKGMLLTDKYLIVADLGAVHYFDRDSGKPVHAVLINDSHMLNALALGKDGKSVYVTDTGRDTPDAPGAIYRISHHDASRAVLVARGPELKRPNGIVSTEAGLIYAPFGQHAKHLYRLTDAGEHAAAARVPGSQLDGLMDLPDGSLVVTSWEAKTVFRLTGSGAHAVLTNLHAPAQPGYDAKRARLLVPLPMEHVIVVHSLADERN